MNNLKIVNGKLTVDVFDYQFDEDSIVRLACLDGVIEKVGEQILDGMTSDGSYGWTVPGCAEPVTPLDKVRMAVAKGAGRVAEQKIEEMVGRVKQMEKTILEFERQNSVLHRQIANLRETIHNLSKEVLKNEKETILR